MSSAAGHRPPLEALGLEAPIVESLGRYLDLLASWNARVNLTGARGPAERVARLVGDVLPARTLPHGDRLLDVGSGNGSPGLVLALLRPELRVSLLEPRLRRWAFLREAARLLDRADVEVLRLRHDAYPGPPAPTVSLRALALPLSALAPLVEPGGRLLVFGTRPRSAEGPFEPARGVAGVQAFRRRPFPPGDVSRET